MLAIAYNTNGFAHHDLDGCFAVLADLGYDGVGLTLDRNHLDPLRSSPEDVARVAASLRRRNLRVAVETGARFVLDPRRKHEPSLLSSEGRERRLEFLLRSVEVARDLGAEAVSIFSGRLDAASAPAEAWRRLADGVTAVLDRAEACASVPVGFEPEPGHLVDTLAGYDELLRLCGPRLRLTLDLGHVRCTERFDVPEAIRRYAARLAAVHIEDVKGREHVHLPLGEGDIDFPPALAALADADYRGLVQVELGRHSHDAPEMARRSIEFLRDSRRAWRSN